MKRKIIYFINPVSGTIAKENLRAAIEKRTKHENIAFEILPTNPQGNYYFLKDKIDTEQITDIVICGGDGTVNQIANTLLDSDIQIGILPAGSGNGLARAAKIPVSVDKSLDIIFNGKARYIDAFRINSTFSCMLCGLGFDAQVAHDFALEKKRGLSTYVHQTLGNFIIARPYPFEIVNQGKSFATEAYFISIANSNQFGNRFTIAPRASLRDGLLDIIIVKKMSKLRMLWSVLKHIRKGNLIEFSEKTFHKNDILYFQTDKLIIHNLGSAPFHIDGEPATTGKKFMIEIIPDAFKLIQPA
jgi:YegS/Rv2252/BmrU family lipid kinase